MYSTFIGVTLALWVIFGAINLGYLVPIAHGVLNDGSHEGLWHRLFVTPLIYIIAILLAIISGPILWGLEHYETLQD
jgi:hypothetical protein